MITSGKHTFAVNFAPTLGARSQRTTIDLVVNLSAFMVFTYKENGGLVVKYAENAAIENKL